MERVPDVFDVFGLGAPYTPISPKGGIALPGLVNRGEDKQYSWTPRLNKQNTKWREGRSPCERPRTYDKFYQKTPLNFQEPQTDSAVSVCSSENEEQRAAMEKDKKRKKGRRSNGHSMAKDARNSKTLTEQDIKHIERHLSMKRTIRKKIMRDLQQAFVKHPTSQIEAVKDNQTNVLGQSEPNILDMLRDSQDSGNATPVREQKFRSCRIRRRKSLHFDSSSEELSNIFGDSDNGTVADRVNVKHLNDVEDISLLEPPPDYEDIPGEDDRAEQRKEVKKTFWQRLIGRKVEKRKQ